MVQLKLFKQADEVQIFNKELEMLGNDYSFLRQTSLPILLNKKNTVRTVDLFCGCGGMSLGLLEACRYLGFNFEVAFAVDNDLLATDCFKTNFSPFILDENNVRTEDIRNFFKLPLGSDFSVEEENLAKNIGKVDILIGGPPCQGHSDLNNSTRRNDPKNELYLYMARAAEVFKPNHVIIENVTGAIHDKNQVVQRTANFLSYLGYHFSYIGNINLVRIGVAQYRKRLLLIASKKPLLNIPVLEKKYATEERNLKWAIEDLIDIDVKTFIDMPSNPSADNKKRINFLFEKNIFDLPDEQRPPCHRDRKHTYKSIYGRLRWEFPAPTITSGFYSMCMGRYVHPERQRTLTGHEAARIQFFPDYFDFTPAKKRTSLATVIGNAVPPKMSYVIARELLQYDI